MGNERIDDGPTPRLEKRPLSLSLSSRSLTPRYRAVLGTPDASAPSGDSQLRLIRLILAEERSSVEAYWQAQKAGLAELPHYAKRLLNIGGVHIRTAAHPADDRLMGPAFDATAKRDGASLSGFFDPESLTVFDPATYSSGTAKVPGRQTLYHEIGHAIDMVAGSFDMMSKPGLHKLYGYYLSESKVFAAAYAADLAILAANPRELDPYFNHYLPMQQGGRYRVSQSRKEAFAEAWMIVLGAPDAGASQASSDTARMLMSLRKEMATQFREVFPNTIAAMSRLHEAMKTLDEANVDTKGFYTATARYLQDTHESERAWYCKIPLTATTTLCR